jgi:hypothetical protein
VIAEHYGVSGNMILMVTGLTTVKRYDVNSSARYTMYREETFLRRWP